MKKKLLLFGLLIVFNFISLNAQNLLTNGGFETWGGGGPAGQTPTGWTIGNPANGTITQNTTLKSELTSSCRIIANSGNYTISQSVPVTAGKTYTLRISYYIETSIATGKEARINCYFRNGGGTGVVMAKEDSLALIGPGGSITSAFPSVTGTWKTYTYDVVAPTGATTFFLSAAVTRTATVSWDNFSFAENTTPTIYKYTYTTAGGYNYSPAITGLDYTTGGPSVDQAFTVKACNLTQALTITAPANFEISANSGTTFYGQSSLAIPATNGTVSPIMLYVRLKSGLSSATYTGNISLTSTGATSQTIPVSGYVGTPLPIITPSVTTLSGLNYAEGSGPSTQQSFTVSGSSLTTGITINAPTNYEVSAISGTSFTNSITLAQSGGAIASTTIYVRLKAGLSPAGYSDNITLVSGATTKNIALSGSVNGIIAPTSSLSAFSYNTGEGPSAIQSFNISGLGLSSYLIVTGSTNYEISTGTGTSFLSTGQILLPASTTTATPIYVRLKAGLNLGSYAESITITSTGFNTKTVSLSGNVTVKTATENIAGDPLKVHSENNEIIVEGTSYNEIVSIYNLVGIRLKSVQSTGDKLAIPVNKGSVYLVKTLHKTVKIVL